MPECSSGMANHWYPLLRGPQDAVVTYSGHPDIARRIVEYVVDIAAAVSKLRAEFGVGNEPVPARIVSLQALFRREDHVAIQTPGADPALRHALGDAELLGVNRLLTEVEAPDRFGSSGPNQAVRIFKHRMEFFRGHFEFGGLFPADFHFA